MIQTVAMVGEEACFTCQLTQSKNILQVTWQKIIPGGTEDVATYNKRFGTKINPPFQEKFKFNDTGLQNSSIVIRHVTKADECCYRCLFNANPEGTIYTKTCLTVYGKNQGGVICFIHTGRSKQNVDGTCITQYYRTERYCNTIYNYNLQFRHLADALNPE